MRKFVDERGAVITETELLNEFQKLKKAGETDAENFGIYVRNCLDKNGTLEEVAPDWMINKLQRSVAEDIACEEVSYSKAIEAVQKWKWGENWTVYEINNRPVDVDELRECICQELGRW